MRDFGMLAAMLMLVPMSIANAFIAYLLWAWTALLSPTYYLYGFMRPIRYNLLFAAITLFVLLFDRSKSTVGDFFNRTTVLLLIFLLHSSLCVVMAYEGNPFNQDYYLGVLKTVVFCVVMPLLVTTRRRIHTLILAIVFGIAIHGVLEAAKFILSGGNHRVVGVSTTMMGDNNHFAVALGMLVPLLFYLFQYSKVSLTRMALLGTLLLVVIGILGTHSRGGLICLGVSGAWLVLTSRRKWQVLALTVVAGLVLLSLAPESWFERMSTIRFAGADDSFLGRVAAWQISSAIAIANPVFGGGFHAVQVPWVWETFKSSTSLFSVVPLGDIPLIPKAAHSIYFEILGDQGFVGLILFIAILINIFMTRRDILQLCRSSTQEFAWAIDLANLLAVAIVAYMVGGAGVSLGYFEFMYVIAMLMAVLKIVVKSDLAAKN